MVINGANINTFQTAASVPQRKMNFAGISKRPLISRFDTLELSDLFKKLQSGKASSDNLSDIRKILSETETEENAQRISEGAAGYIYMELSLAHEAMHSETNILKYNNYSEERAYYQGLLDEPDGIAHSVKYNDPNVSGSYEYICPEGTAVDRTKAEQALANVQSRIDELINAEYESKTDLETFNSCAAAFSDAFGADSSEFTLSSKKYNKLFGKANVTEENYVQTYSERAKDLWRLYDNLQKHMDNFIKEVRSGSLGEKQANAIENAIVKLYGNSFADVMDMISQIQQDKEKTE